MKYASWKISRLDEVRLSVTTLLFQCVLKGNLDTHARGKSTYAVAETEQDALLFAHEYN
jgi:hypothetical protein